MRPYLAILKDSFREAFASRVLWILIGLITFALAALAPVSIREDIEWQIRPRDMREPEELVRTIHRQSQAEAASPGKRIWESLPESTQAQWNVWSSEAKIDDAKKEEPKSTDTKAEPKADHSDDPPANSEAVAKALNAIIPSREFYQEADWKNVAVPRPIKKLIEKPRGELSAAEVEHLNRGLLDAAYPRHILPNGGETFYLRYAIWGLDQPISESREQLNSIFSTGLTGFMNLVAAPIGIFVAILVTASIIPQTFDAGAVDLLFSKPVSRIATFLTKYVGGCAFILLNAVYLLFGIWLVLGLRLGMWRSELLLCIPVFMFLFSIYYSVSALSGLIWRNAIVCVVLSIAFWAVCFVLDNTHDVSQMLAILPKELVRIVPAGESLAGTTKGGNVVVWDSIGDEWRPVLENPRPQAGPPFQFGDRVIGPVYDQGHERLVAIPLEGFGRKQPGDYLILGSREDGWKGVEGAKAPSSAAALFMGPDGKLIVICTHDLVRYDGPIEETTKEAPTTQLGGIKIPLPGVVNRPFVSIGPTPWPYLSPNFSAAMHPENGSLAIMDKQTLAILELDENRKYTRRRTVDLDMEGEAVVGYAGSTVVVATSKGRILAVDAATLEWRFDSAPFGASPPASVKAAPDGRFFVVLFHDQKAFVFDAAKNAALDVGLPRQGKLTAATFKADGALVLVDTRRSLHTLRLDPFERVSAKSPALSTFETAYWYIIRPVHIVFPKPRELANVVSYVLTGQESQAIDQSTQGLQAVHVKLDVWTPIWSSLAFVVVVLMIGSVYVWRADF